MCIFELFYKAEWIEYLNLVGSHIYQHWNVGSDDRLVLLQNIDSDKNCKK